MLFYKEMYVGGQATNFNMDFLVLVLAFDFEEFSEVTCPLQICYMKSTLDTVMIIPTSDVCCQRISLLL
jgi:hypothetical protein